MNKPHKISPVVSLEKGKIPPQAVDLEEVVLGAIMIDQKAMYEIGEFLKPEAFYMDGHRHIYRAILDLFSESNPIDLLSVSAVLKKNSKLEAVGGDFALIKLTQKVASSAHVEFHARVIVQKYIQREVIKMSNQMIEEAYDDDADVFDTLDSAYSALNKVTTESLVKGDIPIRDLVDHQFDKAKKLYRGEIKIGIDTPFRLITSTTGGWRAPEFIILAARPSMGKTALAINVATYTAALGYPVSFFSLEMSAASLVNRIISSECRINGDKFNIHGMNDLEIEACDEKRKWIKSLPLHIEDSPSLSIEQFQVKAKVSHRKHNTRLIIIDYLQLMSAKSNKYGNREQEISKISRGIKKTAMDLQIPIIALSQLSREVEKRGGNKRPQLSDLRESGSLEQDSDVVSFLYRPEYYHIHEWDDEDRNSTAGQAEWIFAKNRNGGLVKARIGFEKEFTRFHELSPKDYFKDDPFVKQARSPLPKDEDIDVPF